MWEGNIMFVHHALMSLGLSFVGIFCVVFFPTECPHFHVDLCFFHNCLFVRKKTERERESTCRGLQARKLQT